MNSFSSQGGALEEMEWQVILENWEEAYCIAIEGLL